MKKKAASEIKAIMYRETLYYSPEPVIENSGAMSSLEFKATVDKLVPYFMAKFKSVPSHLRDLPIALLSKTETYDLLGFVATFKSGACEVWVWLEWYTGAGDGIDSLYLGGRTGGDANGASLEVRANILKTTNDFLVDELALRVVLAHEVKHAFDLGKLGTIGKDNPENMEAYLIDEKEQQSQLVSLIYELESARKINSTISFGDALNSSKVWKQYIKYGIFQKYPEIRRYFLHKSRQWWEDPVARSTKHWLDITL